MRFDFHLCWGEIKFFKNQNHKELNKTEELTHGYSNHRAGIRQVTDQDP